MPQILKEELKEQILTAAKKEFLTKDFQNASIRNIAKSLSCSAGNIYNYFENKDALFLATVQDTVSEFEEARSYIEKTLKDKKTLIYLNFDKSKAYANLIVNFLLKHRENLYLLSCKSRGSKLENFLDNWAKEYAKLEYKSITLKAKGHKELFKHLPSQFFIENLCLFFFDCAKSLVEKDLDEKQLVKYLGEIFSFIYQGWEYYIDF